MGRYLILQFRDQRPDEDQTARTWFECDVVEASSGEDAVRGFVQTNKNAESGGVFLAIPERSAKTIRVKVETVQKVSVDAGEDNG